MMGSMSIKNIVLFGQSGVGKSSVVNLMAGEDLAETSLDTNAAKDFTLTFDGNTFRVFDTIGLEEHQLGMKEYLDAIVNAHNLIAKLDKEGGIDLLLFCVRAGGFTSNIVNNYKLFYESLCQKKVPIVLVITGLETVQDMDNWWARCESTYKQYKVDTNGHACITAVKGLDEGQQRLYEESRRLVRRLVIQHTHGRRDAYKEGSGYRGGDGWFTRLLHMLKELLPPINDIPRKKELVNCLHKDHDMPLEAAAQLASHIRRD